MMEDIVLMEGQLKIPVAFIIFNRLDTTKEVFSEIRKIRPEKLYLISDGARQEKKGEFEKVKQVRSYVENSIDWSCEIRKDYAIQNMGCKNRVASGITWVFQQEEMAIILEDDCKPMQEFFAFAQEMLTLYKDNEKIMMVSGTNLVKKYTVKESYTFSYFSSIWGWATWRRAWDKYDINIKGWPELKKNGYFKNYYKPLTCYLMNRDFGKVYRHEKDTWDFQWEYTRIVNGGLGIVPCVNMIENIGFGRADATHTTSATKQDFSCGKMRFPLSHPDHIQQNPYYDQLYQKEFFGFKRIWNFLMKKIKK